MLPFLTISLLVVFVILWRSGILDDLPDLLSGSRRTNRHPKTDDDPEAARRLEVFKDFLEGDDEES